jgi:hypothetical protein
MLHFLLLHIVLDTVFMFKPNNKSWGQIIVFYGASFQTYGWLTLGEDILIAIDTRETHFRR